MTIDRSTGREDRAAPEGDMVWIPGGTFAMGSDEHYEEERPVHEASVDGFWIDRYAVTNAEFARFVEDTGHVTLAEKPPRAEDYPGAQPDMLFAASIVFEKAPHPVSMQNIYDWWTWVKGADWRHPQGEGSSIESLAEHPVVHITFGDAEAYAAWAEKELPTEAEWEFACRGGLEAQEFAWGAEFAPGGVQMANTWQGEFPWENLLEDGFEGTAPVGSFPPNGYGLFDMVGNVWEWTTDWYEVGHQPVKACCGNVNPRGGAEERSYDPQQPEVQIPRKVIKGGSHLCAPNYCRRYRPAARMPEPIDTSTSHLGFRCIVRSPATS